MSQRQTTEQRREKIKWRPSNNKNVCLGHNGSAPSIWPTLEKMATVYSLIITVRIFALLFFINQAILWFKVRFLVNS